MRLSDSQRMVAERDNSVLATNRAKDILAAYMKEESDKEKERERIYLEEERRRRNDKMASFDSAEAKETDKERAEDFNQTEYEVLMQVIL